MNSKHLPVFRILLIFLTGMLFSCKEFIEPSIANRQIQPEAPGDQYQSTKYNIGFWWDEVDDAISYRVQVVTPDFNQIGGLIIDTLVKGNKFTADIDPGQYQWRVRAENGSSQTAYSTARSFTIVPSSLTEQTVSLISPGSSYLTNQNSILFKWSNLYSATGYRIQVDSNNFANATSIVSDQLIPGQQISFKFPKDQQYQWRVRAENTTEQSKWSTINLVTFDSTPPPAVVLNAPANDAIVSAPVQLQWQAAAQAKNYRLNVYKSDSTTYYNSSYPMLLKNAGYTFSTGTTGERIYWKVTALDAAGNESRTAILRSFVIQ